VGFLDRGECRRGGVFLICDSLFECGIGVRWGGVALELLAVSTRSSRTK
jgi:hypothetical protein